MNYIYQLKRNNGGFYNHMNILIAHYLTAKKNGANFYLDDHNWQYKHNKGWEDYFTTTELVLNKNVDLNKKIIYVKVNDSLSPLLINIPDIQFIGEDDYCQNTFSTNDYINAFFEVYKLQEYINIKKTNLLEKINFKKGQFDAIMIRRGDKMIFESIIIPVEKYLLPLIDKVTKNIFLQTDDYNTYLELINIINDKYKDNEITVHTNCPSSQFGALGFNIEKDLIRNNNLVYKDYCMNMLNTTNKTTEEYNSDEMKEHVENMLIACEICKMSNFLATDYQSNLTRFLYMMHENRRNVINCKYNFIVDDNAHYDIGGKAYNPDGIYDQSMVITC
jgi:hypothetical protein